MEDSPKSPPEGSQDLFKAAPMPGPLGTSTEEIASLVTAEAFPMELKERERPRSGGPKNLSIFSNSTIGTNWPFFPVPLTSNTSQAAPWDSPIPPGQRPGTAAQVPPAISASWKIQKKGPGDYERDMVSKYALQDTIITRDQQMMVVVEGRQPHC